MSFVTVFKLYLSSCYGFAQRVRAWWKIYKTCLYEVRPLTLRHAYTHFQPWFKKLRANQPLPSWQEFQDEVEWTFSSKITKELALQKIDEYHGETGKNKANTDYMDYTSKFSTLALNTEMDDVTLVKWLKYTCLARVREAMEIMKSVNPASILVLWREYMTVCMLTCFFLLIELMRLPLNHAL